MLVVSLRKNFYWFAHFFHLFFSHTHTDQSHVNLFATRPQPKKKRKSRTAFTNNQIFELEKRFIYQKYLSPADRDEIAQSLGLSNAQVRLGTHTHIHARHMRAPHTFDTDISWVCSNCLAFGRDTPTNWATHVPRCPWTHVHVCSCATLFVCIINTCRHIACVMSRITDERHLPSSPNSHLI